MNEKPALFIEFDSVTWQMTAVYFKSSTDEETKRLREILAYSVKCEMATPAGGQYDA